MHQAKTCRHDLLLRNQAHFSSRGADHAQTACVAVACPWSPPDVAAGAVLLSALAAWWPTHPLSLAVLCTGQNGAGQLRVKPLLPAPSSKCQRQPAGVQRGCAGQALHCKTTDLDIAIAVLLLNSASLQLANQWIYRQDSSLTLESAKIPEAAQGQIISVFSTAGSNAQIACAYERWTYLPQPVASGSQDR